MTQPSHIDDPHAPDASLADRAVFALTNAWFYVTRPLFVLRAHKKLGIWPDLARPRIVSLGVV